MDGCLILNVKLLILLEIGLNASLKCYSIIDYECLQFYDSNNVEFYPLD